MTFECNNNIGRTAEASPPAVMSSDTLQKSHPSMKDEVPSSTIGRIGAATIEALKPGNLLDGVGNAAVYDYHHPLKIVGLIGGSALLGGALRSIFPEAAPAALIAEAALTTFCAVQAFEPLGKSLRDAEQATTKVQLHHAAQEMDNVLGSLAFNSLIGITGYKMGQAIEGHPFIEPAE